MYNLFQNVITNGSFELSNVLTKIDKLWLEDKLTDKERGELIVSAQNKANFKNSIDLYAKVFELDNKVKELEDLIKSHINENVENPDDGTEGDVTNPDLGDEEGGSQVEPTPTYPEYVVGQWYYAQDVVSFEGKNYVCTAPAGVVCVWSPKDYPAYWEELTGVVEEENPEEIEEPEELAVTE